MEKWLPDKKLLDYYEGHGNSFDLEKVIRKYGPRAKGKEAVVFCSIEYNEKPISYIQYYHIELDDHDVGAEINISRYRLPYGVDLFIVRQII